MLSGQRVGGRYQILHQIGGGGMSVVYLAHDMILNRDVAIKILRYDFSNEDELHKRFQREALSATSLMHPNIVSVYDVGEDGEMHYIVMEYIKGKTLKKYIQEYAPLSPARSVHIMKQLTSAIAHAHENGIIHRDIKPQNILVDENGDVKITDFGIATSLNATTLTQTNSVMGTVHYLSPEQARGGTATKKSDIYSLGIVLYELLTGELPFSGESAVSIALKHLQSETPSVRTFDATIPQSLENVVLKATAKDAIYRYESAEAMEEDLTTALSPSRMQEAKYTTPIDDDATRAIPIIKEKQFPVEDITNTRVHEKKVEEKIPAKKTEEKSKPVNKKQAKSPKKKRKKWPIFVGIGILVLLLIILMTSLLSPDKIEIPDVKDFTVEEATELLESAGFKVGEITEKHSDEIEKDKVIGTDPRAGLERVKNSEINLIVSLGNETIEMPDFVGKQRDQVLTLIEQGDYEDVEVEERYSDEPEGTVLEQEPKAGQDIIENETIVKLIISKGKQLVKVQNLTGWNESALQEYAKSSGLVVQTSSSEHSDTVPAGQVISQTPKAGANVAVGTVVKVVISKGPAEKKVKTHVKSITIPYEPTVEGAPQIVRVYVQDKTHNMADEFETFEITSDTVYRLTLTIAEGEKATYRIDRDLTVIEEGTVNYDELP